jgi:alpha-mannosidase
LWTWDDTREVIKRDVRSVLAIMDDYPEVTFTQSQAAGYEMIRTEEPGLFRKIVERIHEGRWEPATAQWVEGDTNLASGEAMASQLLEGVSFSREHLGITPRVLLAPDTFGHSANMPQLVTDSGVRVYYHMRCNPGGRGGDMWPAYWWEGLDGTRVLACSTKSYNSQLTAGSIARAAVDGLRAGLSTSLLLVGVGDHGGGPTRRGYDTLRSVGMAPGMPSARCSTIVAYAEEVVSSGVRIPVHRGESPTIFEGCYTTHVDVKWMNRDGENRLVTAETLAALAGLPRLNELTEAWRDLCFHQFHDILDGSGIPEIYVETRADHARLVETTESVIDRALSLLTADTTEGTITVVNPHGNDCADIVAVPAPTIAHSVLVDEAGESTSGQIAGNKLYFLARTPAFGVARYRIEAADGSESTAGPTVTPEGGTAEDPRYLRLETPHFRASIRADCGIITSLIDKRVDRELVAFGMRRPSDYDDPARPDLGLNVFQIVDERPHFMSAWQFQEVYAEHTLIDGATTELVEEGPVRCVVRVRHEFRASRITEDIIFYRDLPRIDFVARVDWQESGSHEHGIPNLKVAFTPDLDTCNPWFEIPYGAVSRRSNGQQVPALRWVDIGGADYGVAVLNDSTYAHDVLGSRVRLTLIRTAYSPDPRSDQGEHTFRFSLVPHVGDWREAAVPHLAAAFNQPLIARIADEPASPFTRDTRWQPELAAKGGVVTAALRVARNGKGTLVRLAEVSGRATQVTLGGIPDDATVWASDLTETRHHSVGQGPSTTLTLRPADVRTLIVERD